ncbi:pectin lyase fold/virulence factor [Mycena rosella]|uniref:galacturonan 1,4-alpha-galacturonidase n=1 Tax=Mycena rosella TaxID=1033263 RepID=A0AAD7D6W5_MYCRO|nr:pectin lyase fold/virulence factor [Mycena rosella]
MTISTSRLCLTALIGFLCVIPTASKIKGDWNHPPPPTKYCTVKHNRNGADDSANILKAFTACSTNSIITFLPANYSAYTPVTLAGLTMLCLTSAADNVIIHLNGNLLLPNNITKTYATPWFYFHGSNVQLIGSADFEWGRFYGFGQHWWDLGNRTLRPQLATFNVSGGLLRNLKVIKPVAWGWNLPGTNLRVENHYVDAKPDNGTRSDTVFMYTGINISGQNITVDGYYGHNGDDCVSVINGARNVFATNGFCGFSSHGLSIGSLGSNGSFQTVQGVIFKNWTMDGAVYGARFKSWTGGAGFADNVTWEDITLVNVSTAIFITQNNSSTHISNFKFRNFKGGLNANWINGGDATQSIIFDLYPGTALNISVGKMVIHPFKKPASATTVICDPTTLVPGEQSTLGFDCTRGPYVATPIQA